MRGFVIVAGLIGSGVLMRYEFSPRRAALLTYRRCGGRS